MVVISLDIIAVLNLAPSEGWLRVIRPRNKASGSTSTSATGSTSTSATGRRFFI